MTKENQKGSVVTYLLIALFLTGLLVAALSQGAKKNASTEQIDEMVLYLQNDIKTVYTAVDECAQNYPKAVDVNGDNVINSTDNPNPPFPLYGDLSSAGVGATVTDIKCPGAPAAQQVIFSGNAGNLFKLIGDTTNYTTKYFTDGTEGVYVRIARNSDDALWTEAISRVNSKYSGCVAANVTDGTCTHGCIYYWVVRRATSVLATESGTCP